MHFSHASWWASSLKSANTTALDADANRHRPTGHGATATRQKSMCCPGDAVTNVFDGRMQWRCRGRQFDRQGMCC